MKLEELYLTDGELIGAELTAGWKEIPHYRDGEWGDYYHDAKRAIAKYAVDNAVKKMREEEHEFLDGILHMPFFEFCLQVKERRQALKELIK